MKSIVSIALTLFFITPLKAENNFCSELSRLASAALQERFQGTAMDLLIELSQNDNISEEIVKTAYSFNLPQNLTEEEQYNTIKTFREIWYELCLEHNIERTFINLSDVQSLDFNELLKAARDGEAVAQFWISILYMRDPNIKQNIPESLRWLRLSAEQGYPPAQFLLGDWYAFGREGIEEDVDEGLKWLILAAETGYVSPSGLSAQLLVGNLYGTEYNNYQESFRWTSLAAKQGVIAAQQTLATMYRAGIGTVKNDVRAYAWFSIAAAQGSEEARTERLLLETEMSRTTLEQAQNLALKCYESDYRDCT